MVLKAAKVSVFIKPFGSTKPNDENKFLFCFFSLLVRDRDIKSQQRSLKILVHNVKE